MALTKRLLQAIGGVGVTSVLSVGWIGPVQAEWAESVLDASAEYRTNDDVNLSVFNDDEKSDKLLRGVLGFSKIYQFDAGIADYTRLNIGASIELQDYSEFDGLDRVNPGVALGLTHKFGLGPDAPWLNLHVSGVVENVDDSDRNKNIINAGIRLGRRFTPRFDAAIDWSYDKSNGKDDLPVISPGLPSSVYDLQRSIITAIGNYQVTPRLLGSIRYSYLNGDINGECTVENVGFLLTVIDMTAHTLDRTFEGCRYRFDGYANTLGLSGSYALGPHTAINFGSVWSKGGTGRWLYRQNQLFVNFSYRH